MTALARLVRRLAALLAFAIGVLLAAFLAALAFVAAAGIGVAFWLNARFGHRRPQQQRPRDHEVIDMTLREIDPRDRRDDDAGARPATPAASPAGSRRAS